MEREIIHIDEELCDGCGECIPNCHEGALQLVDGKARLISDLMCDGLGACIGHCPQGAITMEKREAEPYNETEVIRLMAEKGENTVKAHLLHLAEHNETAFLKEAVSWLRENSAQLTFDAGKVIALVHNEKHNQQSFQITAMAEESTGCGCQGSAPREIRDTQATDTSAYIDQPSELKQWPVQFHLVNPSAGYFQNADLLLAADCSAYTVGNFHSTYMKGKSLIIACPKLDTGQESYLQKLVQLIDQAKINTIQVLMMEVPCCGGLIRLVNQAREYAERKIPVKSTVISIDGKVLKDEWI
ncbi:ATP-binding protein [Bacteroidota bacterium]